MGKGTHFRQQKSIRNWREYNEGLKQRYSLTVWVDEDVLARPEGTGRRGRPPQYGDALIEVGATLKALYRLPYRGTQGMMRSVFDLLGHADEKLPDYTTLHRRSACLKVAPGLKERIFPAHLVVDTTGLKVYGEGEWKVRQHGWSKRRTWRKLHLMLDEHGQEIVASDLTENSTGDQEHLPQLLAKLPEDFPVRQVSGDGIYDTYECYDAVRRRGAKFVAPPRKNAAVPPPDSSHPRHEAIRDCERMGRARWKKERHYHRRSLAETTMFRFKGTFGDRLAARELPYQKTEAAVKVKALNKLRNIAQPRYA
jgi:hypothetical protein